jgi:hypothetical protein
MTDSGHDQQVGEHRAERQLFGIHFWSFRPRADTSEAGVACSKAVTRGERRQQVFDNTA